MSKHYEQIKNYYRGESWDISKVRDAVEKQWITKEEYTLITGEVY